MIFNTRARLACTLVTLSLVAMGARAQALPQPQNVAALSASATVEVARDWLTVVFSTTREGADAAQVQSQLRQALETALAEAKKVARPGQLEVQTGNFALSPRYAPKIGGISGWQGSTELVVEGRDFQAVSQLTGRIQTLAIARVGFSLSREARLRVEDDVTAQAIERFRARADAVARQFGMTGYTLLEVALTTDAPPGGLVQMRAMATASARGAGMDEGLPVEAGRSTVTATVSGRVQMKSP
jgi:predicted secreted protein